MTGLPLDASRGTTDPDDAPGADGGNPARERHAPSTPAAPGGRAAADVYGVLADPTRRRLLTALRGGERSVGDLVIELAVSQPTVSKHLRTLREGGLVRMRASGQRRLYSLRLEPLQEAARWLGEFTPAVITGAAATEGTRRPPEAPAARSGEAGAVESLDADPGSEDGSSPIGRTVGRAAGRAAEMIANIPRLRRRNGRY